MKQQANKGQIFARICSVTGQGMWEGWVFNDGDEYAADEISANKLARAYGYKDVDDAYNEGACYFTEWGEGEENYIQIDGTFYDYAGEDAPQEIYGTEYKPIK